MDPRWLRNSFIYLLILVAALAVFFVVFPPGPSSPEQGISTVIQQARAGQIATIEVEGDRLTVTPVRGDRYVARKEVGSELTTILAQNGIPIGTEDGIQIRVRESNQFGGVFNILISFLPILFLGAVLIFMMRSAQGSNSQAMSFGKSKARMFTGNKPTVTFADVAGVEEAKVELQEVVEFLKYPEKFVALGAKIPRGVLLIGLPGTGKTLLSRAVAGEAGVPFFSISGSEFVEMFVGVGASRVRDLFDQAKRNAPCIVFIDEIDAVGRQRGAGLGGSHDEREQTLNQILVEMDGFDTQTNIIVIAATNRPDVLDPALLRPGRFDRQVILDRPDVAGRKAILEVHTKGKPLEKTVDLERLAKQTIGFSGADLANLVNEGAILAARRNKKTIGQSELTESIDRVTMGPERKSRVINLKEKKLVAYHEGGHAIVGHMTDPDSPVSKVTIVSRGMAGGYTAYLPDEESHFVQRSKFLDMIARALAGHAAEEVVFGEVTTGSSNDIERATKMAREMVMRYGMSARLGTIALGKRDEMIFLGREINEQRNYSERVAEEIDDEVRMIMDTAHQRAVDLINEYRGRLDYLAEVLIERETLEGEDLRKVLDGETLPPQETPPPPPPAPVVEGGDEPEAVTATAGGPRPGTDGDPVPAT